MLWKEIKRQYPDQFILLENPVEEFLAKDRIRIVEGAILKVCDDGKEIRTAYRQAKKAGKNVLYSIPSTPEDFIVEVSIRGGVLK